MTDVPGYRLQFSHDQSPTEGSGDRYEWLLILQGTALLRMDDDTRRMQAGQCALFPPDRTGCLAEGSADLRVLRLAVEAAAFRQVVDVLIGKNMPGGGYLFSRAWSC